MAVHEAFGNVETRWVSDIEPGPIKLLDHRFPDVPNLGDITTVDWADVEPVDIIAGGSPCTDLSTAGKRAGMKPGTRSGLWESMREAIAIIKPAFVVWENVQGALSAKAASESDRKPNENHEYCLCSGPHRRGGEHSHRGDEGEVVCTSDDSRNDTAGPGGDGGPSQGVRGNLEVVPEINGQMGGGVDVVRPWGGLQGSSGEGPSALEDKEGSRPDSPQGVEHPEQPSKKGERECEVDRGGSNGVSTTKSPSQGAEQEGSTCDQCQKCGGCLNEECPDSEVEYDKGPLGGGTDGPALRAIGRVLGDLSSLGYDAQWTTIRASDVGAPHHRARVFLLGVRQGVEVPSLAGMVPSTVRSNLQVLPTPMAGEAQKGNFSPRTDGGQEFLTHAIAALLTIMTQEGARWGKYAAAIRRWEHVLGVPAPDPTVISPSTGRPVLSPMFTEWMMGLPSGWITDVPGITRAEAIRACGNGVVPQQGATALAWLIDQARKWTAYPSGDTP